MFKEHSKKIVNLLHPIHPKKKNYPVNIKELLKEQNIPMESKN